MTSFFPRKAKRVTRSLLKGFSRKTPKKIHFEARHVCCVKVEKGVVLKINNYKERISFFKQLQYTIFLVHDKAVLEFKK